MYSETSTGIDIGNVVDDGIGNVIVNAFGDVAHDVHR